MIIYDTLDQLKNKLPSQYRDNVIDYKTLNNGIHEVVESLNKTGLYDLQCHSHLIIENGMKTNIDNHIRETFKKNKVLFDDNTLIEVFEDENNISPVSDSTSHKIKVGPKDIPTNSDKSDVAKLKCEENHDISSIASVYEKDINYNYKEDLEEELKKSQVKLVKFINQAKDKDEIINRLSLKYYQIFYVLKETEDDKGGKQLKSSLIVSISKVNSKDLDVQKLLDEITGQNTELFEHDVDDHNEDNNKEAITNENGKNTTESNKGNEEIKEEKIDEDNLQKLRESLHIKKSTQDSLNNNARNTGNEISSPHPINDSRRSSNNLNNIQSPTKVIEALRLIKSPPGCMLDERMLDRSRKNSNDSTNDDEKRKYSVNSIPSQCSSSSSSSDYDEDQDNESEDIFEFESDQEVDIVLPKSTSQTSIPKEKEIEPDPIAVQGDSEEMIKKRASIIQQRLSEYYDEDGITKEKFMSLFNSEKRNFSFQKSNSSHYSLDGKLSLASSVQSSFYQPSMVSSSVSSQDIAFQNYWEIPVYSYYTYSLLPENYTNNMNEMNEMNELSESIKNYQEPESIEIIETNETMNTNKSIPLESRKSSVSFVNTEKENNSLDGKELKVTVEPIRVNEPVRGNNSNKVNFNFSNLINYSSYNKKFLNNNNNNNNNSNNNKNKNNNNNNSNNNNNTFINTKNIIINDFHLQYSQKSPASTLTFVEPVHSQTLSKKERRKSSLSNLFKKSNKNAGTFKSYDQIIVEQRRSQNEKAINIPQKSNTSLVEDHPHNSALYVRKTKSHSFSYHFKNPFKKLNSSRKNSTVSICSVDHEGNEYLPSNSLRDLHCSSNGRSTCSYYSTTHPNQECRVEISLESDTVFLNKMVAIFKNLTLFEKDCRSLFDCNIGITKKMLKEVSSPGKMDTYPWRSIHRLYREVDVWTHNGKVNTWQQASEKLEVFKIKAQNFTKKFKMEDSKTIFDQFLKLNQDAITLKQFYEINQTAIYMVLKEHDKDTKLCACEGLPGFITTDFFSDKTCKRLTYELTQGLLSVIPDPEKYSCPICRELAYKPIRLDCNHLFCLKCLIKAQKKNLDNCPVCRCKDAVKNATSRNLDKKLLKTFMTDFPKEIKARKKQIKEISQQQEIEEAKELAAQPASLRNSLKQSEEEESCTIM